MRLRALTPLLFIATAPGCWPAYDPPTEAPASTPSASTVFTETPTATFRPDLAFDSLYTDLDPEGSEIDRAGNWSDGLPFVGDPTPAPDTTPSESPRPRVRGGLGGAFVATFEGDAEATPFDAMDLTLYEEGAVVGDGPLTISDARLTLVDRARFDNQGDTPQATVLQGRGGGETRLQILDGATASFGDLLLGRGGPAFVSQGGGVVEISSILEIGDEQPGAQSVYELAGGLVRVSDLETATGLGYGSFDFALGSTGRLQVRSENKGGEELLRMVDAGALTLNRWKVPRGDFDVRSAEVGGVAYTQVSLADRGIVAHYPFEDDARDVSGHQNDPRTVNGETRIITDSERGRVFDFRGGSEIQLPNMQDQFEGEGTFMLWLRADDITDRLLARFEFDRSEALREDRIGGAQAIAIGAPGWLGAGGEHVGVLSLAGESALELGEEILTAAEDRDQGLFAAWVYVEDLGLDLQYIIGCEEDNERLFFMRVVKGGSVEVSRGDRGAVLRSTQRLKEKTWQHVAYRWHHNDGVEIYIDGALASESASSAFNAPWDALRGRLYLGATFDDTKLTGFLQGRLDDVRFYSENFDGNMPRNLIRDQSPFIIGDPLDDDTPRTLFPRGAASFLVAGLTREQRSYGLNAVGVAETGYDKHGWSHHALVTGAGPAGSQVYRHYINGVLLTPERVVGDLPTEGDGTFFIRTTPRLGSGEEGSEGALLFDGRMDDVRFFNRALTQPEILLFLPQATGE